MSNNKTLESQHSGCKAKLDKAEAETRQYMEMVKKFKRRAARAEEAGNPEEMDYEGEPGLQVGGGQGAQREEERVGNRISEMIQVNPAKAKELLIAYEKEINFLRAKLKSAQNYSDDHHV